jgi:hypothetical protein
LSVPPFGPNNFFFGKLTTTIRGPEDVGKDDPEALGVGFEARGYYWRSYWF